MKRAVLVAISGLGVFTSGAFAADVSIKGRIDETFEASNNYFLANTPSGNTLRSLSSANLNFLAATPVDRYRLDTNYSYYKYFGPGAQDTSLTWGTPADAKFSAEHNDKLTKYDFSASWQRSDLATAALQQIGRAVGRGTLDTFKVDGGVTREVTPRDTLRWTASASTVSYSDPTQTPYADFSTRAAWTQRVSPTITLIHSLDFDLFNADDTGKTQRLFWTPMTTAQLQLTNRLSFNAGVGMAYVNAYQTSDTGLVSVAPVPLPFATSFQPVYGASSGWVAQYDCDLQADEQYSAVAKRYAFDYANHIWPAANH